MYQIWTHLRVENTPTTLKHQSLISNIDRGSLCRILCPRRVSVCKTPAMSHMSECTCALFDNTMISVSMLEAHVLFPVMRQTVSSDRCSGCWNILLWQFQQFVMVIGIAAAKISTKPRSSSAITHSGKNHGIILPKQGDKISTKKNRAANHNV